MACNGKGSCNHAPCPHEKLYRLYWSDPATGERHLLGEDFYSDAESARDDLMDNYWDDRLDAVDCVPVVEPVEE